MNLPMPKAEKIPQKYVNHGKDRVDNYSWLRDENWQKFIHGELDFKNEKIKKYIEEENNYTQKLMEENKGLKEELYKEILGRVKEDDTTYPSQRGDYFYYQKEEKGKNYPILCRKKGSLESKEEIYFDVNKEAEGKKLFIVDRKSPSPDNNFFAYMFNTSGSLERTLKIRDLKTGKDLPWEISNTNGSFVWHNNNTDLFYIERHPDNGRGQIVYKINILKGPESKEIIFQKPQELDYMFMGIRKTCSKRFLLISPSNSSSNVTYFLDLENESSPKLIAPVEKEVQYSVEHFDDSFYFLTNNKGANNFKVMRSLISNPQKENWEIYIKEREDIFIEGFSITNKHLILESQNNSKALPEIETHHLITGDKKVIKMDQEAYSLFYQGAYDFEAKEVRYSFQSPCLPNQTIDLNLETGEKVIRKTKEVPNFNPDLYETKRVFAPSHDGKEIPLTLLYKKGLKLDGKAPALVYAYGSYGYSMPAYFSQQRFSLIERGFIYAIAHIRGGSDKGHNWYLDGKLDKKINTFKDYISCCEYLIDKNYSSKGNIVGNGGSAGGLLMGAVANMKPEIFKSIILDVPFVDVINTITDDTLPLTPPEWEEWGNPILNEQDFDYIMSYSPYDNVSSQNYPHLLFNSGISDEQVTYWEPTKMVAKLRELKKDNNFLFLNMKMHAGHSGATKRYEWIEDEAFNYAFVLKCFLN
ncbi:MAG: S9 family peptidase [Bdellovibrionota bacterium]|nr:S9 family peptidase [Bdellovibrionota bacterium]